MKRVWLGSKFFGEHPNVMLKEWSKHEPSYVEGEASQIVRCYNKHIGGVDALNITVKNRSRIINPSKGFINLIDAFIYFFSVIHLIIYPVFT